MGMSPTGPSRSRDVLSRYETFRRAFDVVSARFETIHEGFFTPRRISSVTGTHELTQQGELRDGILLPAHRETVGALTTGTATVARGALEWQ